MAENSGSNQGCLKVTIAMIGALATVVVAIVSSIVAPIMLTNLQPKPTVVPSTVPPAITNVVQVVTATPPPPTRAVTPEVITNIGSCPPAQNTFLPAVNTWYGKFPDGTYLYLFSNGYLRIQDDFSRYLDFFLTSMTRNQWQPLSQTRYWVCVSSVGWVYAWYDYSK